MADRSDSGIGEGLTPTVSGVKWGHFHQTTNVSETLYHEWFPPQIQGPPGNGHQDWSAQISREYYIYEDFGHGNDEYLVVYREDGIITPGQLISEKILTGGDHDSPLCGDLCKGYFHHKIEAFVAPSLTGDGVSLTSSSPSNANNVTRVDNQVVSTSSDSISIGGNGEGPTGDVSVSTSTQVWHGVSFDLTDWNVLEQTDVGARKAAWLYYQGQAWDGRADLTRDFSWWEAAYNVGGGWDDVKLPPSLSRTTLKYHNTASWRFKRRLTAPDGSLRVSFSGGANVYMIMIAMPQFRNIGHHQATPRIMPINWNDQFDIVEWANKK
ncbi:hypothetical protein [Paramagnetospirillum kuznetsovii]|uniref:hypothetical protein n=1 Tax=Paramagnetospirillum kuznetsovii TaxID=2053833 RepID=UPI0011BF3C52|nr:hypothetical protein [Paramagnetospirillum kuznetsovii]